MNSSKKSTYQTQIVDLYEATYKHMQELKAYAAKMQRLFSFVDVEIAETAGKRYWAAMYQVAWHEQALVELEAAFEAIAGLKFWQIRKSAQIVNWVVELEEVVAESVA